MPKRTLFIQKLLNRLDKIDRSSLQTYVSDLVEENVSYQDILDHLSEGILLTSKDGRLLYFNQQASQWLGLKNEPSERLPVWEHVSDSELSKFIASHLSGLSEKMIADIQTLIPREMKLRVMLIPIHASKQPQVVIILTALSETSLASDGTALRVETLKTLAAGIAHEIGNPLNSLNIHLEILKKDLRKLPETQKKSLEKTLEVLNNETSRLDRIVRSFLKATRKQPLRFKTEDINMILEEACRFLEHEMKAGKIKPHLQLDKSLPAYLLDSERLYQAFLNLIKNAIEAMPKGGNLWISTSRKDNLAIVSFKDEGEGITENDLPHIFEAYYTTKEEGSGLGLMTVYNVVREHGGRIEVSSKLGKGTLFVMRLPIRQPKLQLGYKK